MRVCAQIILHQEHEKEKERELKEMESQLLSQHEELLKTLEKKQRCVPVLAAGAPVQDAGVGSRSYWDAVLRIDCAADK